MHCYQPKATAGQLCASAPFPPLCKPPVPTPTPTTPPLPTSVSMPPPPPSPPPPPPLRPLGPLFPPSGCYCRFEYVLYAHPVSTNSHSSKRTFLIIIIVITIIVIMLYTGRKSWMWMMNMMWMAALTCMSLGRRRAPRYACYACYLPTCHTQGAYCKWYKHYITHNITLARPGNGFLPPICVPSPSTLLLPLTCPPPFCHPSSPCPYPTPNPNPSFSNVSFLRAGAATKARQDTTDCRASAWRQRCGPMFPLFFKRFPPPPPHHQSGPNCLPGPTC